MQKWEYYTAYIQLDKKQNLWVGKLPNGNDVRLSVFLAEMGENGWEICSSAQAFALGGNNTEQWYALDHWLYFKRPKNGEL